MNTIDRKICEILQENGRASNAEVANAVGLPVSTTNDHIRRLVSAGTIAGWRATIDPSHVDAELCAFILIDMRYDGEAEACKALQSRPEVLELHHVSGPHSYLMKVRVQNTSALQHFLQQVLKPLKAVQRSESIFSLDALKETSAVMITPPPPKK